MPAKDDAAAQARFQVISGQVDRAGAGLEVLHDGKVPAGSDDPRSNFFFAQGSDGGRILVDLGKEIEVGSVVTYSWHRGSRAAQRYTLFGAGGEKQPEIPKRPDEPGKEWSLIDKVDTSKLAAGQHGVVLRSENSESLGTFRYLLFEIFANQSEGHFKETFFSEIDVIDAKAPEVKRLPEPKLIVKKFPSKSGRFTYTVDATDAPDLADWAAGKLVPVMDEWYPRIIEMLPVKGVTPSTDITFTLKPAGDLPANLRGVPAYASGTSVVFNADFMRRELKGEAIGAGIHEIVHVVQFGGRDADGRITRGKRLPTWVTEGAADYIRWFLFEPEKRGARINHRNFEKARHDSSYRISAHFFNWVIENYDKDLMRHINESIHQGYREELWVQWTGKPLPELAKEWREANRKRLGL